VKVLLIYPDHPETFWGFKHALKFISKKAVDPPLGLVTVAAMLPEHWEKRLIDMKVTPLKDIDLKWADLVFISAMSIQRNTAENVIKRCREFNKKVVAGGPLFTIDYDQFDDVDYFVLNEAEITLPRFLNDLEHGNANRIYETDEFANMRCSPIPAWELLDIKKYAAMDIQYSRGCPFNCEFCNVSQLLGQRVRTKTETQVVNELERLYKLGWRSDVFFVDDNFIGNKNKLKKHLLPAIIEWMASRKQPFRFSTEASINLADDDELMALMTRAGFNSVFIGIETLDEESLTECNKIQNKSRDLVDCVKRIQRSGLQVKGGFILGFDNDPPSVFEQLKSFIQESGIVTAMVGLLNAPRGTRLYSRLKEEGRLLKETTGDNTDFSLNFTPVMDNNILLKGYREVISGIYSCEAYYKRIRKFISEFNPMPGGKMRFKLGFVKTVVKTFFILGIVGRERIHFWKLFFWTIFKHPRLTHIAMTLAVYGLHFRKIFERYM